MSRLHDPSFLTFHGEPITGRTPTKVVVSGNNGVLTPMQTAGLEKAYSIFRLNKKTALGDYFTQTRRLPDGTTIRMVSNMDVDQVFVTVPSPKEKKEDKTEEEQLVMAMDSGIVRLEPTSAYGPGYLYRTAATSPYETLFTNPSGEYFFNPSTDEKTQIDGSINVTPRIQGAIKANEEIAQSFMPKRVPDPGNPGQTIPATDDAVLQSKRNAAANVPASVFTGRCRLFVQATYGSRLHLPGGKIPTPTFGVFGAPVLGFPGIKRSEAIPPALTLTTSSGIFFDPITCKHWVVTPPSNSQSVSFIPLVSDNAGEALRKRLRPTAGNRLSTESAREKAEAFILSRSRPDTTKVKTANLATMFADSAQSMGYGWHWNWSGTEASIVINKEVVVSGAQRAIDSTLYKLNIYVTYDGFHNEVFAAALTKVEGPTRWACSRAVVMISYPAFDTFKQQKLIPKTVSVVAGVDAPFYAFYKKNTLTVCRVVVTQIPEVPTTFSGSVNAGNNFVGMIPTVGMHDGYRHQNSAFAYKHYKISVGGTEYGPAPETHTSQAKDQLLYNKVAPGPHHYPVFGSVGNANFRIGYPANDNASDPAAYSTIFVTGNIGQDVPQAVTFTESISDKTTTHYGSLVCFTPAFDAEAIVVFAQEHTVEVETKNVRNYSTNGFIWTQAKSNTLSGWPGTGYVEYDYYGWGSPSTATSLVDNTDTNTTTDAYPVDQHVLLTNVGGTISASLPTGVGPFYVDNTREDVDVRGAVWSGTPHTGLQVVRSDDLSASTGLGTLVSQVGDADVLVGWT